MNCTACGHPDGDHDRTFRTCSQERYGNVPYATKCESECREMQYDTTKELA